MDTIFMNSENSKISDPKINLRSKDEYVDLSNLSIYYTWENIKKSYKKKNLKDQLRHGMMNLNYLMDHIVY